LSLHAAADRDDYYTRVGAVMEKLKQECVLD